MKNSLKLLLVSLLLIPVTGFALTKEETIYSTLNNDGKLKSTIVTNHLSSKEKEINDETELTDILNINDNEKFKLNGNSLNWQTSGSDIFYRGNTKKALPIDTNISYYLNGKKMNPKKMLDKNGEIKIVLSFKNTLTNVVKVNGKYETLYTPFVVTIGTMLNSENTNIKVSNGKVVNTGSKNLLVGIASPGLYESVGLKELKGLNKITITYDTSSFSLGNIYIVSTPKLLNNSDFDIFKKMDSLYNNVDELQSNMNLIEDDSKKINSGSTELKNKLKLSIDKLSNDNSNALSDIEINNIKSKIVSLVSSKFTDDYKLNIANAAWSEVKENLDSTDAEVIKIVTESVTDAVIQYLKDVNEYNDYVNCEKGKYIMSQGGVMTIEEQNSCGIILNDNVLPRIKKAAETASKETASKVSNHVAEKVSKSVAVNVAINSSKETASTVSESLSAEVANTVKKESIKSITNSLSTLYNGINKLDLGITSLTQGISKFNNSGIKLLSSYSYKIKSYSNKLEALKELTDSYKGYTSNNSDSTLFVSKVSTIK